MCAEESPAACGEPVARWTLPIGGILLEQLEQALEAASVAINPLGKELLVWLGKSAPSRAESMTLVAYTVDALGFAQGATLPQVLDAASRMRLGPCTHESAPYLRLHVREQPEGVDGPEDAKPEAPSGAWTVVTPDPGLGSSFPRGFYLRQLEGTLWLRGYRADDLHVWKPSDILVLRQLP
jgi:hypothetical protein